MSQWARLGVWLLFVAIFVMFGASAFAATGTIAGNILDKTTGEPLPGANLMLEGTSYGSATDRGGSFRIANVPDGDYTLIVSYLGYEEYHETVEVRGRQTTTLKIELMSAFVTGEEVTFVGGQRTGQAAALNQQRTSPNIVNIVASDQIGSFPDPNVAESLQRIPGVGLQRDQGEGRYITIRGTDPSVNNVMINGQRVPSPEGDVRSVALDVIPADQLGAIEVNKTFTPDMDMDGIGGLVNLTTRSALDYDRPMGSLTFGGGYNVKGGGIGQGALSYGTQLGDDKNIGVMFGASYYITRRGSDNMEAGYDDVDVLAAGSDPDDEDVVAERYDIEDWTVRDYILTRERASVGANIDYQLNPKSRLFFNGLWNQYGDDENRRAFNVEYGNYYDDGTVDEVEVTRELKNRYEVQRIWTLGQGGEFLLANDQLELDYYAAYSYAEEEEPDRLDTEIALDDDFSARYNHSDANFPTMTVLDDININDVSGYELDKFTYEDNLTTDDELSFQTNLKYHLDFLDKPSFLKTGFKMRSKNKDREAYAKEYENSDDFEADLSMFVDDYDTGDIFDNEYDSFDVGLTPDPDQSDDYWEANQHSMDSEEDIEAILGESYEASETIYAGYLMASTNFSPQFTLLGGARVEMTDIEYTGNKLLWDADGDFVGARNATESNDYANVLPALHLIYRYNDRTNFRFAFSQSIARPDYYDLVPYTLRNREDEELELGNPELDPALSTNIDLMVAHYYRSLGVASVGFFYKTINDYIYYRTYERTLNSVDFEVVKPWNAGEAANLMGIELAWAQQLSFLPGFWNGFGVYFNYTWTDSELDLRSPEVGNRTIPVPGQAESVANFALSYEKYGFSGRLSLSYTGSHINEVGVDERSDEYWDNHMQLDFTASQRVWNSVSVYLDLNNITNEAQTRYVGDDSHPIERELYSFWGHMGVKYEF